MLAAVLHLSTAMPKPSAAALKPAAQMDATLVTKLNSGGWKGPTAVELKAEAPFESSCGGWCGNHTTAWEYKCFWSAGVCSTCDECTGLTAPLGPRCEPWCAGSTMDWTTKCSWKTEECSTCGGCIAPSFPPSPYTPPVPSTPPPPLAPSPSPPPPWEYSSAICRSQHHADLFFKNPHLDDCPVGDGGLLMCSQATTVGTLCYYSVGSSCGAAAEAPLQPYSCCVAGNKDATCNGGNVILQVAIPPSSPPPPPPPPFTPPPASFWGSGQVGGSGQGLGKPPGGANFALNSWQPSSGCATNNPNYNKHYVQYINMGSMNWVQCMQIAAEYKLQVNGAAGNGNIYPAWSPITHTAPTLYEMAYAYSGTWTSPAEYQLSASANCVLTKYVMPGAGEKAMGGGRFMNFPSAWASTEVRRPVSTAPGGTQCLHFKYAYIGSLTSYMCQYQAAANGASVLSPATLGKGSGYSKMPTFHGCNTVWYWAGTYPQYASLGGTDEGPANHDCIIGYLDHLC